MGAQGTACLVSFAFGLVTLFPYQVFAAAPAALWHHPLYLDGGGWWPGRIRVVVENGSARAAVGEPVAIEIGNGPGQADLAGQAAESVRVCNEQGVEMLFASKILPDPAELYAAREAVGAAIEALSKPAAR